MKLEFTVKGEPQGKGRPRFTRIGKPYTPENTASYEEKVRLAYWEQCGMEMAAAGIPLTLEITAVFGVPERFSKAVRQKMLAWEILPTKRPDADNIAKIIADALNGVAWHDDAQVTDMTIRKVYGENPEVRVCLSW